MAGTKTSALAALTTIADGDLLPIVDISDTTQAPSGSTKRTTAGDVSAYVLPYVDARRFGVVGNGSTDDTAALQDAIDSLTTTGGTVYLRPDKYLITDNITVPDGVNLDGAATGWNATKSLRWGASFLAGGANAKITFEGAGGYSGKFSIDGDNVATGPLLEIGVGTGRTFDCVLVKNSLGDGCLVYGLQNSLFTNLEIRDCVGDLLTLDNGSAYNVFEKFEIAGTNGYHLVVTETTGTGPLGTNGPTNNHFLHGIFEYSLPFAPPNTAVGVAHLAAGQTFFDGCAISSSSISTLSGGAVILVDDTAPAAPLGATVFLRNCLIQGYATGTPHIGIKQLAGAVRLQEYTVFTSVSNGWLFNGGSGRVQGELVYTGTLFDPASTQPLTNIFGVQDRPLTVTPLSTDAFAYRNWTKGEAFPRLDILPSGSILWGPGTAGFDTNLFRVAASVLQTNDLFVADLGVRIGSASAFSPTWMSGAGDPNGAVAAGIGSLYSRTTGGASTTLYVKESGAGTNTGWVAK